MKHFRTMKRSIASMSLVPLLSLLPQGVAAQASDEASAQLARDGSPQLAAEGAEPVTPEAAVEEGEPQEMPPGVLTLFQRGLRHLDDEQWTEARDTFQTARAVWDRPNIVFNLALAHYHGSEFLAAEQAFQDFAGMAEPSNPNHAEAERLLGLATEAIATVVVRVDPAGAVLWIDDARRSETGAERAIRFDPGQHDMRVEMQDFTPYEAGFSLTPGEILERSVLLVAAPVAELLPLGPVLMVGGGGTLLAAALVTGIMTSSAEGELEYGCPFPGVTPGTFVCLDDGFRPTKNSGKGLQVATNVLLVLGSATAISGGIWWLLSPREADEPPPASVACGSDGCHAFLTGAF